MSQLDTVYGLVIRLEFMCCSLHFYTNLGRKVLNLITETVYWFSINPNF